MSDKPRCTFCGQPIASWNEEHTIRDCYNALRDRNAKLERAAEAAKVLCSLRGDVTEGDRAELRDALADLSSEGGGDE